ncbi:MAG TPA: NAD(P)-dependent oxidoreductase [Gammaproteobacteria bacterium]|nr:NAD(P)-dependent oxidoreductase [Gammaproteobacteria bacterium]
MTNITILGTGAMGARMAKRLLDAGYSVTVFNRTRERALPLTREGARFAATPVDAVRDANIVISMLTNDEASRTAWLDKSSGAIAGLKKDTIAIESSTLSLGCITQLAKEFNAQDIAFLDAPVLGSRPQADSGALIFLVGGKRVVLDKVMPVLSCMSSAIHYTGANSTGVKMKLAINAFFGAQVSALSEIIGLLKKTGIAEEKSIGVFNQLPTTSPALQGIGNLISAGKFDPLFPVRLMEKDLCYALDMSHSCQSEVPVVNAVYSVFNDALEHGLGEHNINSIIRLYS